MQKLTKILGAAICLLLLSLSPTWAQDAENIRISVSHDGTVKEVLDVICAEIDGSLLVRNSDVDLTRKVKIQMRGATVNEILTVLFGDSDVKWTISGKQIQIYRPQARQQAEAARTITGTVTDENGEPVIGAAVMLAGNNKVASTTDEAGHWTLQVPQSARSLNVVSLG